MTDGNFRARFEARNPLPEGVHWDGEFYSGTHNIIGSYTNATIWNHMYCGYCQGFVDSADVLTREVLL